MTLDTTLSERSTDRTTGHADAPDGGDARAVAPGVGSRLRSVSDRVATSLAFRLRPAWSDRRVGLAARTGGPGRVGTVCRVVDPAPSADHFARGLVDHPEPGGRHHGRCGLPLRWSMLVAPFTFVAVFELVRVGIDGPTVDAPHVSTYGILAMVVGRGVHGLLTLFPMVLGAAVGAGLARTIDPRVVAPTRRAGPIARRTVAVISALGLVALTVFLVQPA